MHNATHYGPCHETCLCLLNAKATAEAMRKFRTRAKRLATLMASQEADLSGLENARNAPDIRGSASAAAEADRIISDLRALRAKEAARRQENRRLAAVEAWRAYQVARQAYLATLPR